MAEDTAPTTTERKAYYYPPERAFTGLVQFRMDAEEEVDAPPSGKWRRGEVKAIKNEQFAIRLVSGGKHAHAPAGTPLGQPEEFKPKTVATTPTEPPDDSPMTDSQRQILTVNLGFTPETIDGWNYGRAKSVINSSTFTTDAPAETKE